MAVKNQMRNGLRNKLALSDEEEETKGGPEDHQEIENHSGVHREKKAETSKLLTTPV